MTATIIQFVPKPNPNRPSLLETKEAECEDFAAKAPSLFKSIGIVDYINGLTGIPYGGQGIDGMDVTQANAFHAPENDPA